MDAIHDMRFLRLQGNPCYDAERHKEVAVQHVFSLPPLSSSPYFILPSSSYSQVREAKRRLLDNFYTLIGREDGKALAKLLDENPEVMSRRQSAWKRLELLRKARDEIDAVGFARV